MRTCNNKNCSQENPQPLTSFFKDKNNKTDGRYSLCKTCKNKATYAWRNKNRNKYNMTAAKLRRDTPDRTYGYEIKRRYGYTLEQYNAKVIAQDGKCAVCNKLHNPAEKKGRLYIDHCHKTGKVRDLICGACNSGLGYFMDDTRVMAEAIAYIIKHRKAA